MLSDQERLVKLGRYIKEQRTIRNMSTYYIENAYGVDRALWSKLETGKLTSMPKPEFLLKLSLILSLNVIKLYIILGYLTENDVQEFMSDSHRLKEQDYRRISLKP